ncbi:sigma-70 family RNA polymerase sigma factor [Promicromonospora kroppenstedtii]|uniref:sigma-70 family RNA polymerase sigma factor n=1 Tax=Promicromonospora kroppenstedtii TaxID=440482 RepID=UPI000562CBD5|nr:sigma-70 family RNA polymerase sigma factor [Promicromonospora kroppenstedtii]
MDLQIAQDNQRWVLGLGATGPECEAACEELYSLLHRVARREVVRRASSLRVYGPELDDIAHQAAADALMAIRRRLDTFRGESRFTTWACKFVIFDVATKVNRHFWRHHDVPYDHEDWSRTASRFEVPPGQEIEAAEFVDAISAAIKRCLTERQRTVFMATVINKVPMDVLAEELGSSRNALYKVLFDARKKLRAELVSDGYLSQ